MTDIYLFIVGTFVTLIWLSAVMLLVWEQHKDNKRKEP